MTFEELLDQAIAMLERRGRVTYRALKRQFQLDDDVLKDLTAEIIKAQRLAMDEDGEVLVWTGMLAGADRFPAPVQELVRVPNTYTPPHLAEKILTSKAALEGERKQETAEELIPGSLKRSMSYAEELAKVSRETLEQIERDRNSPLREKARNMLKLIKQSERLLEKTRQKGGSA
jgi:flagellar hook-basal body complex protein FliE